MPSDLMNARINGFGCPSDPNELEDTTAAGTGDPPPGYNNGRKGNYLACSGSEELTQLVGGNSHRANGMFVYSNSIGMSDVRDGTSNTLMLGEILLVTEGASNSRDWRGRYWRADHLSSMFSTFLTPNTSVADKCRTCQGKPDSNPSYAPCQASTSPQNISLRSFHPGGVQVALGDGSVRFATETVDAGVWKAVGTRNGGETDQFPN